MFPSSYPCLDRQRQNQFLQFLQELGRKEDERRPPLQTVVLVPVFVREAVVGVVLIIDDVVDVVGDDAVTVPMIELRCCVSNGHGKGEQLQKIQRQ